MAEVGFLRRVAPAVGLAAAGGLLLYLLPSGADTDPMSAENLLAPEASSTPQASTAPTTASTSGGKRVVQGDPINFRYGTVQADVALDGTTITDITTITAPGGGYQRYTDRAIPGMKAEILAAQSTRVAAVSGATYTSLAYAQSVQSALNKA